MAGDGFDGGKACASDPRNQRRSVPREVYGTLEDVPDLSRKYLTTRLGCGRDMGTYGGRESRKPFCLVGDIDGVAPAGS